MGTEQHGLTRRRLLTTAGAATAGIVAAGLPAGPAAAAVNDAHLLIGTLTSPPKLLHKLRRGSDEGWIPSPEWGDVYPVARTPYPPVIVDVAAAMVGNELHTVSAQHREIAHAIRYDNGNWTQFSNVSGFGAGRIEPNRRVCAAGVAGALHVAVQTWDGVFHTIRNAANWLWTPLTRVPDWDRASFTDIAAAGGADGYFHLFALQGTQVLHRVRDPHTRIWSPPGSPGSAKGQSGKAIAAGRAGNEVHAAVQTDGGLSHVVRRLSGSWSAVNRLSTYAEVEDVGAAGTPNGEFQVTTVGIGSARSVWHRVRRAGESWTDPVSLGDVVATRVAMAG